MLNFLNIPKIPIMVFELIRYPILKREEVGIEGNLLGAPEEVDIVPMDVMPTTISYKYGSKKSYYSAYGDNNTTVDKGGNAPVRINFSGSFGSRFIRRGLKTQDGFGRLKEFIELYRKSQTVEDTREDSLMDNKKFIYGLNFYDFTFHYWGAVDLDVLDINGDAGNNSKLPFYNVAMTGIGDLIYVKTRDPILRNLQLAVLVQTELDKLNDEIDIFLKENPVASTINEIIVDIESFNLAIDLAKQMSSQYGNIFTNTGIIESSGLLNAASQSPFISIVDFAKLL